jgi:putative oxidoreductase
MFRKIFNTSDDYSLTIVRLILGVVFFAHGAQKMLGWFGGHGFSATMAMFTNGMHVPALFAFLSISAEFFGGPGLIVGLLGRIASFGIMCNMAIAIAMIHHRFGLFMNWAGGQRGEGYEFHLVTLAVALIVLVKGSGALSIDRMLATQTTSDMVRMDHSAIRQTA